MSQHDLSIADQLMPAARTDINNALQALGSTSKGASAPTTAYTGQLWLDDDTPSGTVWTLKCYDGTDWIEIGQFNTSTDVFTPTGAAMLAAANVYTKTETWKRGSDVASAGALSLGDGNIFNITGTTAITSIGTKGVGTIVILRFTGALTFTHHATDLILPTGANITTAAGDYVILEEYASGDWRVIGYQRANGYALAGTSNLVQRAYAERTTVGTGTTVMNDDDTLPQNTEGDEYLTLAITPTSATNRLRIEAEFHVSHSVAGRNIIMALFQDSTANALRASYVYNASSSLPSVNTIRLRHEMVAGSTSALTFKIRIGGGSAGTLTVNGGASARKLGGALISSITIDELVP